MILSVHTYFHLPMVVENEWFLFSRQWKKAVGCMCAAGVLTLIDINWPVCSHVHIFLHRSIDIWSVFIISSYNNSSNKAKEVSCKETITGQQSVLINTHSFQVIVEITGNVYGHESHGVQ